MSKMEALLYSLVYHTLFTPLRKYTIGILGSPYKLQKQSKNIYPTFIGFYIRYYHLQGGCMGRVTEYIAYLNSKDEKIDKSFSYLTITDKIAQKRHELIKKNKQITE